MPASVIPRWSAGLGISIFTPRDECRAGNSGRCERNRELEKVVNFVSGQTTSISDLVRACLAGREEFKTIPGDALDASARREMACFNLALQRLARNLNARLRACGAASTGSGCGQQSQRHPIENTQ